jgi:hypothetical protein
MKPLPSDDLRSNLATWLVPVHDLPAVARAMLDALPPESFDPSFQWQKLETTYFDTAALALRKARRRGPQYLTLRLRCYDTFGGSTTYTLSVKTESEKWRHEIPAETAELLLQTPGLDVWRSVLPGHLQARLASLVGDDMLWPVVCVQAHRYAVENEQDRLTLDVDVRTDTDKRLPAAVLEFKSTEEGAPPPAGLAVARLRPIKLSKFLWATEV